MSVFADSSAIVKLYADEEGHEKVRGLAALAVAEIARVEVPAAFWRKHRIGEIGAEDARVLTAEFESDYYGGAEVGGGVAGQVGEEEPKFAVVATTSEILDQAATLCAVHGLRAYDAVQLSTALATRRADPECSTLEAFDSSLRGAASAEGFQLLPEY
ncbi:MAG TPA: type II toxin-antitoxin system VapC family toxin [Acidimicrobiales bacterium]|nr:type II toxin-antitoxin system VapC family toxin [Acidimicrobiales bacterium]